MKAILKNGQVYYEEESDEDLRQKKIDDEFHRSKIEPKWLINRKKQYREKIDPFLPVALSEWLLNEDKTLINNLKQIKNNIKRDNPKGKE